MIGALFGRTSPADVAGLERASAAPDRRIAPVRKNRARLCISGRQRSRRTKASRNPLAFAVASALRASPSLANGPIRTRHRSPALVTCPPTDFAAAFARLSVLKAPTCRSEEHTSELQSLMRTSYAV